MAKQNRKIKPQNKTFSGDDIINKGHTTPLPKAELNDKFKKEDNGDEKGK
ncbi:hypothetical protein [Nonlabens sp. YIK11]|nr:hypothetical protein [Nonlabens sp. YIK11]